MQELALRAWVEPQLRWRLRHSDELLCVHQMGRVGSKAVEGALRASTLDVPVFHSHLLNPQVRADLRRRRREGEPWAPRRGWAVAEQLSRRFVPPPRGVTLHIVSLTREPISRNISAFFENLPQYAAHAASQEASPQTIDELVNVYKQRFPHESMLTWFDQEIADCFGIDVYAAPFDRERGFRIYERGNVRLLVLRMEDLKQRFADACAEFLGLRVPAPGRSNTAAGKASAGLYQAFKSRLQLDPGDVDRVHCSRYATHFYTSEELLSARQRWTRLDAET